jgi:cell division protein FtsZ
MEPTAKDNETSDPSPRLGIIGVGGAGGNAINNMIRAELAGVNYLAANTDAQALAASLASHSLQLGAGLTSGLGSGAQVAVGRAAAEESTEEIKKWVAQCDLMFIAAGMGGGTGTGAAPVIAEIARDLQTLSVGVVTLPFDFEGPQRMRNAIEGLVELEKLVDTLIVIPNQNLFAVANASTTLANAFVMADEVLHDAIRGITDLIVLPGLINLDFADVRSVITKTGRAMMGTGEATGEGRAINAAEAAIANPLLDIVSIKGAQGLLINVTGGPDMTLFEIDEAANRIRTEVGGDNLIIFGSAFDPSLDGKLRVSVVATGLRGPQTAAFAMPEPEPEPEQQAEPEPEAFEPPAIEPAMAAVMEAVIKHAGEEPKSANESQTIPAPTVPQPEARPAAPIAAPAIVSKAESVEPEPEPKAEEKPEQPVRFVEKEKSRSVWEKIFRS